ncbi:MAG: hypothetical protein GOV15_00725, partial [Candidatus Diapherotrites archaeon]|nr:hypothetical protein [Candidatus Diapherotrites archaeon]
KELTGELTTLKNALLNTQTGLRETFIDSTNDAMDELWSKLYPYEDYTTARLEIDDGDYVLRLKEKNGTWKDVDVVASGGERSSAALALRLSFALILAQNLSWIILDEPTHNLDKDAIRMMSQLLKNNLPNLINQIFLITHEEQVKDAATHTTYVLERNKNIEGWVTPKRIEQAIQNY